MDMNGDFQIASGLMIPDGFNTGSIARGGRKRKGSTGNFRSFFHACQADSQVLSVGHGKFISLKSNAVVTDCQLNAVFVLFDGNVNPIGAAVFGYIIEGFLYNPVNDNFQSFFDILFRNIILSFHFEGRVAFFEVFTQPLDGF